jgi:hypothetical protein
MSETYWKAVRPDGTDFWTGTVRWLPKTPLKRPHTVRHPSSTCAVREDHSTSLAVSTDPTNLPGALWPMRLCRVEQVEDIIITDAYKRQSVAWRVVEEVDPSIRFGPQGPHVAALIARAREITGDEVEKFNAARESARESARDAVWKSARDAVWKSAWFAASKAASKAAGVAGRESAWIAASESAWVAASESARVTASDAVWGAVWDAARALVVRDLIGQHGFTQAHYDTFTLPWRTVIPMTTTREGDLS